MTASGVRAIHVREQHDGEPVSGASSPPRRTPRNIGVRPGLASTCKRRADLLSRGQPGCLSSAMSRVIAMVSPHCTAVASPSPLSRCALHYPQVRDRSGEGELGRPGSPGWLRMNAVGSRGSVGFPRRGAKYGARAGLGRELRKPSNGGTDSHFAQTAVEMVSVPNDWASSTSPRRTARCG